VHVSWEHALAWRVAQQLLGEPVPRPGTPPPPAGSAVEAARRLAGVQAQVMSSAELAIGVRTGAPPSATRTALRERRLTKTWAMRGTLHLFPSDELPTWVAALRAKEAGTRRTRGWEEYHGVTVPQLAAITGTVGDVLGREPMTRVELAAAVTEATGDPALGTAVETGFGGTILKSAAANGDLCFGPDRGRNVTFVDPRLWLAGPWEEPEGGAALALVVRRFLDAYGPATEVDFARWWGVPPAQGKRVLRPQIPGLVRVELGDAPAWMTEAGAERLAHATPLSGHVRLLPAFDVYVTCLLRTATGAMPGRRASRAAFRGRQGGSARFCSSTDGSPASGRTQHPDRDSGSGSRPSPPSPAAPGKQPRGMPAPTTRCSEAPSRWRGSTRPPG
jgi:hypothetical protein